MTLPMSGWVSSASKIAPTWASLPLVKFAENPRNVNTTEVKARQMEYPIRCFILLPPCDAARSGCASRLAVSAWGSRGPKHAYAQQASPADQRPMGSLQISAGELTPGWLGQRTTWPETSQELGHPVVPGNVLLEPEMRVRRTGVGHDNHAGLTNVKRLHPQGPALLGCC